MTDTFYLSVRIIRYAYEMKKSVNKVEIAEDALS